MHVVVRILDSGGSSNSEAFAAQLLQNRLETSISSFLVAEIQLSTNPLPYSIQRIITITAKRKLNKS